MPTMHRAHDAIHNAGPNFHAMAEIHFATWTRWVQSTGSSWHAAATDGAARVRALWPLAATGALLLAGMLAWRVLGVFPDARSAVQSECRHLIIGMSWLPMLAPTAVLAVMAWELRAPANRAVLDFACLLRLGF